MPRNDVQMGNDVLKENYVFMGNGVLIGYYIFSIKKPPYWKAADKQLVMVPVLCNFFNLHVT